jgi:hypothetical protein
MIMEYEATGGWKRQHNKELYALYSSLNIIREIKSRRQMSGACSTSGGSRAAYRLLV